MIHVDEVIELFNEHFPNSECDASADKVEATLTSGNLKVKITFIEKQQVFNFDNGRGKTYTASNFETLKSNVETFFYMENDFKPKSQAVCSVFKNQVLKDAGVVIKGIRGGNNQSFIAIYSVSGTDDEIIIKAVEMSIFEVTYQDKVFVYSIDEAGNIYLMATVDNYSDDLHKRYEGSTLVSIARTGVDTFSFKYEDGLIIDVTIKYTDSYKLGMFVDRVEYLGTELQTEVGLVELEDICDLAELYTNFDYLIDEQPSYTEELDSLMTDKEPEEEITPSLANDVSSILEDASSNEEGIWGTPAEDYEVAEEVEETTEDIVEETIEEETSEEPTIEEETSDESEFLPDVDDFSIILITDLDNKPSRVRFILPERFLDMNIAVAKELGIPVNSIVVSEQLKIKRGMLVTGMELERRVFAVDISSDNALCSNLVDKLFS